MPEFERMGQFNLKSVQLGLKTFILFVNFELLGSNQV